MKSKRKNFNFLLCGWQKTAGPGSEHTTPSYDTYDSLAPHVVVCPPAPLLQYIAGMERPPNNTSVEGMMQAFRRWKALRG